MDSETYLRNIFSHLTREDFLKYEISDNKKVYADEFLYAFYKYFTGSSMTDISECYIEYIIRNKNFYVTGDGDETSSKNLTDNSAELIEAKRKYVLGVYNEIRDALNNDNHREISTPLQFLNESDIINTSNRRNGNKEVNKGNSIVSNVSKPSSDNTYIVNKNITKKHILSVLSMFIKESFITEDNEINACNDEMNQEMRELYTENIIKDIKLENPNIVMNSKKDVEFNIRSKMLNIWHHTEQKIEQMAADNKKFYESLSVVYVIDSFQLHEKRPSVIKTFEKKIDRDIAKMSNRSVDEIDETFPVISIPQRYTNITYSPNINLVYSFPIDECSLYSSRPEKTLYICTGSGMIQGGNSDQGFIVEETMLYMTSSYSGCLAKTLPLFPLAEGLTVLLPKVLVFKNTDFKEKKFQDWVKISVLNAPVKWRPKLSYIPKSDDNIDIYDIKTRFALDKDIVLIKKQIESSLEIALFLGYQNIIFDDHAIDDNILPAYQMVSIVFQIIKKYETKFKEIKIALSKKIHYVLYSEIFNNLNR